MISLDARMEMRYSLACTASDACCFALCAFKGASLACQRAGKKRPDAAGVTDLRVLNALPFSGLLAEPSVQVLNCLLSGCIACSHVNVKIPSDSWPHSL